MSWTATERENIHCLNIIKGWFNADWGLGEDANRVGFFFVFVFKWLFPEVYRLV